MVLSDRLRGEVQQLLEKASSFLPFEAKKVEQTDDEKSMLSGNWQEYEEFLEHNELELAWDALASLGKQYQTSEAFWSIMIKAAALMGLKVQKEYAQRMQKKNQLQMRQNSVMETT